MRIYKLNTFDCFTEEEHAAYNKTKSKKGKMDLLSTIQSYKGQRTVKQKCLYIDEETKAENTWKQIYIFESDVVRLALGDNQPDRQLIKEIVFMEIHHIDILKQIIFNGIKIDDADYILYSATSGQVRDNTVTLISKDFYNEHEETLMVGLTKDIINKNKINIGKYLSYIALSLSSSVLPENEIDIDKCIVVKGLETVIEDYVKFVDIDANLCISDIPKEYVKKKIKIEHTDGAGMFLPGKQKSSFQIRSGHFKGAMFPFDFLKFAKEKADNNTTIVDAWNDLVDVEKEDIQYIFTTSQFKMWQHYNNWSNYKEQFKKHGIKFTVNNLANPCKDKVRANYQVFQTLPDGSDIEKICEYTIDRLIKLHTDLDFVKQVMKLDNFIPDDEKSATKSKRKEWESRALDEYPQLIYDDYFQKEIARVYISELHKAKAGKIFIDGYYSYVTPDMYAFCEYLFRKDTNPIGLVPKNHIYNKYYSHNDNVSCVCLLRSPHLTKYEHPKRKLIKNETCDEWFRHMTSDTVVSCHDLISKSLQMDWDGDEVLISPDSELLRLSEDTPPLYYDMDIVESKKVEITYDNIFETLKKGFENNIIGEISNAITKLWNQEASDSNELASSYPYDNLKNVLCVYSNYSIDYPKKGENINLGEYKSDYKILIENKSKIKLPNFFIETKNKESGNVAKINNSIVNRIKALVKKKTYGLKYDYFKCKEGNTFNYTMLMDNSHKHKMETYRYSYKYEKMRVLLRELVSLKEDYNEKISKTIKKKNANGKDIVLHFDLFHYVCTQKINEIFKGDMVLAANCIVDLIYFNHELGRGKVDSRIILWDIMGHILIRNILQNKTNGGISVMPKSRLAYRTGLKGCADSDRLKQKADDRINNGKVKITKNDYDFLINNLTKMKSGKYYANDKELLFYLICLYKSFPKKNGYMLIPKNASRVVKQGGSKKEVRYKLFTLNKIMGIVGVNSCAGSMERFRMNENIEILEDDNFYKLKLNLSDNENDDVLITVHDFFRPTVYLNAYETGKPFATCKECNKHFNRTKNNQKTCSDRCADELKRKTTYRYNHRKKDEIAN